MANEGQERVSRKFAASIEMVWPLVCWEGTVALAGTDAFERVDYDVPGTFVGATKWLHIYREKPIRERLDWIGDDGYSYGYSIIDRGVLPIKSYEGYLRLTREGANNCHIEIGNRFVTDGVDAQEFGQAWQQMERQLLEQLAEIVEKK